MFKLWLTGEDGPAEEGAGAGGRVEGTNTTAQRGGRHEKRNVASTSKVDDIDKMVSTRFSVLVVLKNTLCV